VEFATRDWYIRRCAAEGVIEGRFPNVTDPVMMLDAGSIFRGNLGFGRQRPKGSLLESVGVGGGVADMELINGKRTWQDI